MVNVFNTSNNDDLSALITAAYISSTYKVESTRSIAELWKNFREKFQVNDNLEYVAAILALGRMMDIKEEVDDSRYISMIKELFETFMNDLKGRGHGSEIFESYLVTALVTSACISRTEKIETVNEIISQWEEMNDKLSVNDDLDKLSGILTIGRINEFKYDINNINQILDVQNRLRETLAEVVGSRSIDLSDFAAAFITTGYLEITPKVERIQDMVKLWQDIQKDLKINDPLDYVSSILTFGRVRDLSAQYFLTDTSILEIKDNIRKFIDADN